MIRRRLETAAALTVLLLASHGVGLRARAAEAPVAAAAMREDLAEVRALMSRGADVNAAQGDGMTALHWAAERGNAELTALLLTSGARATATTRLGSYTPLHLAARRGHDAAALALITAGADVSATASTGVTPLHLAAGAGSRATIEALLARGAAVDVREPEWGQTPLMFAASAGRTDAVKALLAAGADLRAAGKVVDISERNRSRRRREPGP